MALYQGKNDEENSTNNTIFDAKLVALWQLIRSYRWKIVCAARLSSGLRSRSIRYSKNWETCQILLFKKFFVKIFLFWKDVRTFDFDTQLLKDAVKEITKAIGKLRISEKMVLLSQSHRKRKKMV